MGEVAGGIAVEPYAFHSELFQEARHDDAADAVHGVHHYLEVRSLDCGYVHGLESKHGFDMLVGEVVLGDVAEFVHGGEVEVAAFGAVQNGLALGSGEEFAVLVKKLEGVPLAGIVRCREDDAAVCLGEGDCQFRGGSGCEAALHHIYAAGYEGAADELLHHFAAQARVAPDDYLVLLAERLFAFTEFCAVGIGELHYVDRGQALTGRSANGAADTGNAFNECHTLQR